MANERTQGFLEKALILAWVQEIHTMNLEHLGMPESKEMLTPPHTHNKPTGGAVCQRDTDANLKAPPAGQSWDKLSHKIISYWSLPQSEINTHDYGAIQISG